MEGSSALGHAAGFSGSGDVVLWLDQFEQIFELNADKIAKNKTGEDLERAKVLYASTRLVGDARSFADAYKLGASTTWKPFREALETRFSRTVSGLQAMNMLSKLRMKKTQSVAEFAQDIMRVAASSRKVVDNDTLVEVFCQGLPQHFAMALKGRVVEDGGFVDVQRVAEEMLKEIGQASVWSEAPPQEFGVKQEGAGATATAAQKGRGAVGKPTMAPGGGGATGRPPMQCYACGGYGHSFRACAKSTGQLPFAPSSYNLRNRDVPKRFGAMSDEVVCWSCGQKGHMARNCGLRKEKRQLEAKRREVEEKVMMMQRMQQPAFQQDFTYQMPMPMPANQMPLQPNAFAMMQQGGVPQQFGAPVQGYPVMQQRADVPQQQSFGVPGQGVYATTSQVQQQQPSMTVPPRH